MTQFTRGSYGSISFIRTGCTVLVYRPDSDQTLSSIIPVTGGADIGWCIKIGGNVHTGFNSRRGAVEAVSRFI